MNLLLLLRLRPARVGCLFRCKLALFWCQLFRPRFSALQPAESPQGDGSGVFARILVLSRRFAGELLDDGERAFVEVLFLA